MFKFITGTTVGPVLRQHSGRQKEVSADLSSPKKHTLDKLHLRKAPNSGSIAQSVVMVRSTPLRMLSSIAAGIKIRSRTTRRFR
ncbi:hypothetical protein PF005_g3934 [Phytophthora fragariae]|nr:hypothetical protein PF009_g3530 [Phytophthora fragariae]KAE9021340.1 hypothetical protein PF011_g4979 [Phytophthora fragariae]KAE9131856.1 hypothetical protein PF007_g3963 [Phytophthora fragariae]KAE9135003.1 hypothetical protein PF010_g2248 [Phytophthora fragariae]KAE9152974.1 hypothetical protein PF006_g2855 [Phytophthora fragariae]